MDEFRVIEQLKSHMRQRLLHQTVRELADELGMDHGNMQNFLNGGRGVGLKTFARICEILQLELKPKRKTKGK